MQPGFFQSKQFLVSGIVAVLLIAGGAAAYSFTDFGDFNYTGTHRSCDPIDVAGTPADVPAPTDSTTAGARNEATRTISYAINVTTTQAGTIAACTSVGDVRIESSPDGLAHVVFTVRGDAGAVADTGVTVHVARSTEGATRLAAWESRAGVGGTTFNSKGASVDVAIRVPELGAPDVVATSDVGDVLVSQLLVRDLTITTDVGQARALGVDITGNVTMTTNVNDIELRAASIQSGHVKLVSDVGAVTASFPVRADIGYDATGRSDVGNVRVDIGPTELHDSKSDSVGGNVHARSKDYDSKLVKVVVQADSNVGDVTITAG